MADGGASSFIMLVTALLISGAAGTILIDQWGSAVRVMSDNQQKAEHQSKVSIDFAGDPMMVIMDSASNNDITIHVLNSGEIEMNTTIFEVYVNGQLPSSTSTAISPSGTKWVSGYIMEITLSDAGYSSLSDNQDIKLFVTATSEFFGGHTYTTSFSKEVRLHEI
jgi:archaellum component FlaG (FlaF/FlaG flagellin family)